jgi:arylsulfatase A-like enzyme
MSGGVCHTPVHGCDLFPTICQAAGIDRDEREDHGQLDGRSLRAVLRDPDSAQPPRTLFWHYPHFSTMGGRPSSAVRNGRWKLLEQLETEQVMLYDLHHDIGEKTDLSMTHPAQVEQLYQSLVDWRGRMRAILPSRPNPGYRQTAADTAGE